MKPKNALQNRLLKKVGLYLIAFAVTKYWKHDKINTVNRSWKRNNIDPYLILIVPIIFTW